MFKPGDKKPEKSGRKKGTPNKNTQTLLEKCEEKGVDVFCGLLELAKHQDDSIRFSALKEVAQYLFPKRKHVEHAVDPKVAEASEQVDQMNKEQKIELLEQELKRLKEE